MIDKLGSGMSVVDDNWTWGQEFDPDFLSECQEPSHLRQHHVLLRLQGAGAGSGAAFRSVDGHCSYSAKCLSRLRYFHRLLVNIEFSQIFQGIIYWYLPCLGLVGFPTGLVYGFTHLTSFYKLSRFFYIDSHMHICLKSKNAGETCLLV